jgi:hypothetical protein
MKKIVLVLCLTAAFMVSGVAMAGGYKSAGCGLGSLVIKDDGIIQIFAATTNGTFGSQTFGITSGTSNCAGSGGFVKNEAEQEMYVSSNLDSISQEAAQGSGEHLNALATLIGCDKAAAPQFSAALQKNFRTISSEKSSESLLHTVKTTVSADPVLNKACNNS